MLTLEREWPELDQEWPALAIDEYWWANFYLYYVSRERIDDRGNNGGYLCAQNMTGSLEASRFGVTSPTHYHTARASSSQEMTQRGFFFF